MLFLENLKLALNAIKTNKMRSFLTMLGIIIGISSVIAITSIGDSAKAVIGKEFDNYGKNNLYIYLNWRLIEDSVEYSDLISPEDIEALKKRFSNEIAYIAPSVSYSSKVTVARLNGKFDIQGVAADYNKYKKMTILKGRMINESDVKGEKNRIVIDKDAAMYFFNSTDVVGKTLPLTISDESKDLTIVGVYEVEKSIFSGMMSGDSYTAYSPYTILENVDRTTSYLDLYATDKADISTIGKKLTDYLSRIKDKPNDLYLVETLQSQQGTMDKILGTLSLAIGAIAAISLIVGGIGIMNIMLVSVTERTREIGIRKSLGARTKDILQQFLIESMIISAIGGLIGTFLGIGIAAIGMSFAKISIVINPMVIIIAVVFSAVVGMFFGLYPARKAAKLDPIEALRYE
ncbi:ABC transporter permease [Anaerovorax odorimutans]|uniref:ABC transporter permease n=1 Tax=Anaerovorax odorimutans TaxID=109327 RepID=UPI0004247CC0|nr:ABC transporter permease [Anaerovorax odorimutans]